MRVPDRLIALLLFLVSMAVYVPSIEGEFVFDDRIQIENNQLIQRPEYFGKALLSDVFAFRSEAHLGGGYYWRPVFVAWLIANYKMFGVEPTGWHLTSLLVYGLVVVLAYFVVRRVGGSQVLAACAALLFAVHPAHVESVAWISGVTDPLLAVFYLGSLLLLFRLRDMPTAGRWAAALGLYACALLAKEPAIFFPLLAVAAVRQRWGSTEEGRAPWSEALRIAAPFAGVALVYLFCRAAVLNGPALYYAGASPLGAMARNFLTAPSAIVFYLREALLPLWIAPAHALRSVTPATAGLSNFALPLAGLVLAALIMERIFSRDRVANFAAGLFFLSLTAALNVAGLGQETVVQDRYLFVPLLGVTVLVLRAVEATLRRTSGENRQLVSGSLIGLTVVLAVVLAGLTVREQATWSSDEKLWDAAVENDPQSAWAFLERSQLNGRTGRWDQARRDVERAYLLSPFSPEVILQRAEVAIAQARYAEAIGDLRFFLEKIPASADARTKLGIALQGSGQYEAAVSVFREGRERTPVHYCSFTQKMAIVMAQSGKTAEAIQELEAVRSRLSTDPNPDSRLGLKFLGFLYRQEGRGAAALEAEREFLDSSAGMAVPAIVAARAQITGAL
ncbi:MAG: phospholipid carrier-dependent glycosyltransferase [Acidobacteria bacterium]|nr:phospholipid carrier-dependent glycosyltransferase [Acidobacteriota bacterium]